MTGTAVSARPSSFSVIVPVGPTDGDLVGLEDILWSVLAHAGPHEPHVVLVDDAPAPRGLQRFWPTAEIIRTPAWEDRRPDPLTAHVTGTILALGRARGRFALKLDTDALVIAPFFDQIAVAFDADPTLGVVGAYDRSPDGGVRDWSMWPRQIRRTTWPFKLPPRTARARRRLHYRPQAERAYARAAIAAACRNPTYRLGAHCLGGAYAVSERLLQRAGSWDWRPWAQAGLGEDVVVGLLCAAAGLRMQGMVAAGEPFGVKWSGLAAAPAELVERGYSIVHSVKSGEHGSESELRAWFRANSLASAGPTL